MSKNNEDNNINQSQRIDKETGEFVGKRGKPLGGAVSKNYTEEELLLKSQRINEEGKLVGKYGEPLEKENQTTPPPKKSTFFQRLGGIFTGKSKETKKRDGAIDVKAQSSTSNQGTELSNLHKSGDQKNLQSNVSSNVTIPISVSEAFEKNNQIIQSQQKNYNSNNQNKGSGRNG